MIRVPEPNSHRIPRIRDSIFEPVPQLNEKFTGIIPVESSKGDAVVEFDTAIGDVKSIHGGREALTKIFAQRQIERCMAGEIAAGIGLARESISEAGAVVDVGGGIRAPRERDIGADVERVALVVIERAEARAWIAEIRGEIRQSPGDRAATVRDLVRVGKMKLGAMGDAW